MRLWLLIAALCLTAGPALAGDPAEGVWLSAGGDAKVRIAPCPTQSERLCGTLVWTRDDGDQPETAPRDVNNPDPRLRSRSIIGIELIHDFQREQPGRWTAGKIYDPNSGRTYDSNLRLNPDGTLRVEGCLLRICVGQTWRRAS